MRHIVKRLVKKNWNSNWNENMTEEDMVDWVMKFAHEIIDAWVKHWWSMENRAINKEV